MKSDTCYNSDVIVPYVLKAFAKNEIAWPFVCFVKRRESTETLAKVLSTKLSTPVLHVHGGMKDAERQRIADDLIAGKISGVVATSVWATGIDLPNLKSVVRAAGGSAPIGLKQESGRGTRLSSAKDDFIIYDVAVSEVDKHLEARYKNYVAGGYDISGFIKDSSGSRVSAEDAAFCDEDLAMIIDSSKSGTKRGTRAVSMNKKRKEREQLQPVEPTAAELFQGQMQSITSGMGWLTFGLLLLGGLTHC